MRNQKKVLLEQLDHKLNPFLTIKDVQIPDRGWVHTIRTTLNMTLRQLAKRLNISIQGAKDIEKREAKGSISLKSLNEVAQALDMKLVYGFIPNHESIEAYVDIKAQELARKIVTRTSQSMKLEDQGNSDARIKKAIEELADDLKRGMKKTLWD